MHACDHHNPFTLRLTQSIINPGGYHADRHCFGSNCPWDDHAGDGDEGAGAGAAFRLYQWDLIDAFVYFSHRFVTIPPPGWSALCHRHGVRALGTLITEWDAGRETCRQLFASRCGSGGWLIG